MVVVVVAASGIRHGGGTNINDHHTCGNGDYMSVN